MKTQDVYTDRIWNPKQFNLKRTFHTKDKSRDNFISRVFGIFNEEIVRIWCKNPESPYNDLGRPSFYKDGKYLHVTLDFTLQEKNDEENIFISEMKCEPAYNNYSYLQLNSAEQINDHTDKKISSFDLFLKISKNPQLYDIRVQNRKSYVKIKGAILIWGCVNKEKKREIMREFGFHDILSLEDIVNDLIEWDDPHYKNLLKTRYGWISEMFSDLYGQKNPFDWG